MITASEASASRPLISIVLPAYNGATYLGQSLQSCLDQSYPAWELIVVDDASTDATPAIIKEIAMHDSRVRCIRHETNRRLPGALNTGFAAARGEYLTWTSDDNLYRVNALEAMAAILTEKQDVDFVYADFDVIDEAGQFVQTNVAVPPIQLIQQYFGVPCFLYRRRVHEQLGAYAEDLFLAEDYDYWLRILLAGYGMYPLHQNLYQYRRHAASLTDIYRGRTFQAAEQALLRNLPHLARTRRSIRGEAYLYLASLASWRGDYRAARWYTVQATRYAPARVAAKVAAFALKRTRPARGGDGPSQADGVGTDDHTRPVNVRTKETRPPAP
jgi:glycosyltransferase involved in cell wall biosynthesis